MPDYVSMKHDVTIGNALLCLCYAQMGFLWSFWSIVHYFQFLFFIKINVSHLLWLIYCCKDNPFLLNKQTFIHFSFLS